MSEPNKSKSENNTDANDFRLWSMLYLVSVLRQKLKNDEILHFEIGTGLESFGTLSNNVVIHTKSGNPATYALQVKFSTNQMNHHYVTRNPKTCIYKFFESFLVLRKVDQMILWTNATFAEDVQDYYEEYVPETAVGALLGGELVKRYRLKKDRSKEILEQLLARGHSSGSLEEDVEDFFERFVLYVDVAKLESLKRYLIKNLVNYDQFDQLCELIRKCTFKQTVDHILIDQIFTLLKLREMNKHNPYIKYKLGFDVQGVELLKTQVAGFHDGESYSVKASYDIDCTVSRLMAIVKERFVPHSEQCLMIRSGDMVNKDGDVLTVLRNQELVQLGIKCVIISGVTCGDLELKKQLLQSLKVLKIFVGSDLSDCFVDDFDVRSLDENSKTSIKRKLISFSNSQKATVEEIFSDELFRKDNHRLVLELFRTDTVRFNNFEVERDPYYIRRLGVDSTDSNKKYDFIEAVETIDGQVQISTDEPKTIIISDQPGSGKTSELINITLELRQKYQPYLIAYLDCKEAIQWFADGNVENMVCLALAKYNQLKALLIEEAFRQRKVILLMDGCDEVSSQMRPQLESLIRCISEKNIFRLYIATRPHYAKTIAYNCPSGSITRKLELFSEVDQLNYVSTFLNIENIPDLELRSTVANNANVLIRRFRSMLNDSLVGIPLQTHMIATIFSDDIRSVNFTQPESFEIGAIYKQFIELKFQEAIRRGMDKTNRNHESIISTSRKKIEPDHMNLARSLYNDAAANTHSVARLQPYGIVRLQPPGFVHRSYQEYFLALYFLTHFTGANGSFMSFMNDMLNEILIQEFLDYHIANIDPDKDLSTGYLEEISDDFNKSSYVPPENTCINSKKLREFNIFLVKDREFHQHFQLIDFSTANCMINLFEVLYDALPYSTKSIIHFTFSRNRSKTRIRIVDARVNPKGTYVIAHTSPFLKNRSFAGLTEPQVVRVLKVLQRKHPKDLIRRYLLNMKRDSNFLTWIFCYRNEEALEWFMKLLPQLEGTDRSDFMKYFDDNSYALIEQIMEKNASQFLRKFIECVKNTFNKESIARFLRVKHIFLTLLKRIAYEKDIEVDKRVEMVKIMFEFFDWSLDGCFSVASDGFVGTVNKFQHAALRLAFRETFYQHKPHLIEV